jgi:hypothetical protein
MPLDEVHFQDQSFKLRSHNNPINIGDVPNQFGGFSIMFA